MCLKYGRSQPKRAYKARAYEKKCKLNFLLSLPTQELEMVVLGTDTIVNTVLKVRILGDALKFELFHTRCSAFEQRTIFHKIRFMELR